MSVCLCVCVSVCLCMCVTYKMEVLSVSACHRDGMVVILTSGCDIHPISCDSVTGKAYFLTGSKQALSMTCRNCTVKENID